jgi:hypothetical protein
MRRVCLLLALLAVPAVQAGSAPANGCPAPCSGQVSSPPGTQLLFVQPNGVGGAVHAYDPASGTRVFSLPPGITSADGNWHVTAGVSGRKTLVTSFVVESATMAGSMRLDGRRALEGVSPNGRFAALTRRSAGRRTTDVVVANVFGGRVAHRVRLRGDFEVETVSNDGERLFLIQHLETDGAPRYLVRLFDLSRERLASKPLRGAGEPSVMAGLAWSGVGSPDGRWLLTLYLNTDRNVAFVHALDLVRSSPVCIFLPSGGSFGSLKRYGLTLSPDGRTLYATNPALGAVAEIDLGTRQVVRTVRFAPARGVVESTPLTGSISRNGRTLYFSPGKDLWAYDAAYGVVRGPYRTGGKIAGFGFGAGDKRVHALSARGRMLTFDAATGARLP